MRKLSIYGTIGNDDGEQLIAEVNINEQVEISKEARQKVAEALGMVGVFVTSMRKCEVLEYELN